MQKINLRSFTIKVKKYKPTLKRFLTKIEKLAPKKLDKTVAELVPKVWAEIECLSCANCCKVMTPTYTQADIKRISTHFKMTPQAFKDKWLAFDKKAGDWQNKNQPCQFLNLKDNKCSIYEIRPEDCSGFPHFGKKKMLDYMHVHKQNIEYCPATYKLVELMKSTIG